MFDIAPIVRMQSMASDWLTYGMLCFSAAGLPTVCFGLACAIAVGINFRSGLLLMNMVAWTNLLADAAKQVFELPRPSSVDASVQQLGLRGELTIQSYGFPSGHASATTAFWSGIVWLYQRVYLRWIAASLIIMVAISRVYLGRHFIGDVLGGIILGAGIVLITKLAYFNGWITFPFGSGDSERTEHASRLFTAVLLLLSPLALFALAHGTGAKLAGNLLGINSASLMLFARKMPLDSGSARQRATRIILGFALFMSTYIILKLVLTNFIGTSPIISLAQGFPPGFVLVWGTAMISAKFGWYGPSDS